MAVLTETRQFLDALFNTVSQAVESFDDGVQLLDAADFLDEALSWEAAVKGLAAGFPAEAKAATPADIDEAFNPQVVKLVAAGLNQMLAFAIVSNLKGIYATYATIVQTGGEVLKK